MHLRRPYLNIRALTVFLIAAVPLLALGLGIVLSNAQSQLRESFENHDTTPGAILLNDATPPWVRKELRAMGYVPRFAERGGLSANAGYFVTSRRIT